MAHRTLHDTADRVVCISPYSLAHPATDDTYLVLSLRTQSALDEQIPTPTFAHNHDTPRPSLALALPSISARTAST